MADSQPPGAPPAEWKPRRDGTTQIALIKEEVDELGKSMARMEGKVEQAVTWPKLVAILGGFAATTLGVAWMIVSGAASRSETNLVAAQKQFADDVRQLRSETAARLDRVDAKQDAQNRVLLEGQPRGVAREELEKRTGEKRDPDYWKRNR